MKKQLVALLVCVAFGSSVNAQVNPHAIGVRAGSGNFGTGAEVSYQHGIGESNRIELDAGLNAGFGLGNSYTSGAITGVFHWVWNITEGFNWFIGPGAQIGIYVDNLDPINNGITIGVGGQGGVEYDFNDLGVPLLVSVDSRPMFGFLGGTAGFGYGGAISARYTF